MEPSSLHHLATVARGVCCLESYHSIYLRLFVSSQYYLFSTINIRITASYCKVFDLKSQLMRYQISIPIYHITTIVHQISYIYNGKLERTFEKVLGCFVFQVSRKSTNPPLLEPPRIYTIYMKNSALIFLLIEKIKI